MKVVFWKIAIVVVLAIFGNVNISFLDSGAGVRIWGRIAGLTAQ